MIRAKELEQQPDPASLPLYGIPFGVKDSIDVAGVPTTLACPDYSYQATAHGAGRLPMIEAGAIYVGKTNLDQFATGLNGTRTPYSDSAQCLRWRSDLRRLEFGSALAVAPARCRSPSPPTPRVRDGCRPP